MRTDTIKEGKEYKVVTNSFKTAICLKKLNNDRALFAIPDNEITPFVTWNYYYEIKDDNFISCTSGSYYHTLEEALEAEVENE